MNEGGWLGLLAIVVSSLFALLNKREQNRHDDKIKDQATEIVTLQAAQAECKEESKQCSEQHAAAKVELASLKKELQDRDARDKADLQREIDALRRQVATKKDKTDTYPPLPGRGDCAQ